MNSAFASSLLGEFQIDTAHGAEIVGSATVDPYVTAFALGDRSEAQKIRSKAPDVVRLLNILFFTLPPVR